jgi:hypothetical protein
MTIQIVVNTLSCAALFWVCGSFLLIGGQATTLRQLGLQAGMLIVMVSAMACAIIPFKFGVLPSPWSQGLRGGGSILALGLYDARFGIRTQLQHFVFSATDLPRQLKRWWQQALDVAHYNARSKRTPKR